MSLGRAWVHDFPGKINAAARHGYQGLEIFHEDLVYHARTLFPHASDEKAAQIAAAHDIKQLCAARNIGIINLQPFSQYDGLVDRQQHAARIEELHHWFSLAHTLGTDMIQVPASFLPANQCSGDIDLIVSDLQKISDLGAAQCPPIRYVYESLCWSTHVDLWEQCYDIVERVNRPNFGICLDTFNIAGRIYADPASPSGKTENAEEEVQASIARMLERIDVSKVFFIQIVDAERLESPLVPGHAYYDAEQPCRMSWSRNCRLFYGETDRGAYLPVRAITDAIINGLGFQGWVSMELFNRSMNDGAPGVPEEHARRGAVAWEKMIEEIGLDIKEERADSPLVEDLLSGKHSFGKQGVSVERVQVVSVV